MLEAEIKIQQQNVQNNNCSIVVFCSNKTYYNNYYYYILAGIVSQSHKCDHIRNIPKELELYCLAVDHTDDHYILRIETLNMVSGMIYCYSRGYNRAMHFRSANI